MDATTNGATLRDARRPGWYWIDNETLLAIGREIGVYGIAIYSYLAMRSDAAGQSFPKIETIAVEIGCGERKVRATLKELEQLGLLEIEDRRPLGKPSLYKLRSAPASHAGGPGTTYRGDRQRMPEAPAPGAEQEQDSVNKTQEKKARKSASSVGANSVGAAPPPPRQQEASGRRDLHFEALAEICGLQTQRLTKGNRALLGKGASGLRQDGATPELIRACGETWYSEKFGWKERSAVAPPSVAQAIEWVGQRLLANQSRRDRAAAAARVPRPYLMPGGRGLKPITSLMGRPEFAAAQPGDPSTYPAEYLQAARELGVRCG
jgi:hypothetical protein